MTVRRYPSMLVSSADRDRSVRVVKESFVEGRLTAEELDQRLGKVLVSRYFEELMALTADLPVGPFGRLPAHPVTPAFPRLNRLAVAALVCAGAGPVSLGITAIPAVALGEMARRRIRRTGERGFAAATAAVVLGCLMALIAAVAVLATA
ncbi:MAG TPA: DUF1707 and DUF4190 domain-containing protein [Streptosporangiaceae bacterium]|nr:DUF1707 and DUF4190 domain-containing protein [Streptosporangiaceae bacterium]